jgi:hypothetical protein
MRRTEYPVCRLHHAPSMAASGDRPGRPPDGPGAHDLSERGCIAAKAHVVWLVRGSRRGACNGLTGVISRHVPESVLREGPGCLPRPAGRWTPRARRTYHLLRAVCSILPADGRRPCTGRGLLPDSRPGSRASPAQFESSCIDPPRITSEPALVASCGIKH